MEQIGYTELTPLQHIIINSICGNANEYTLVKILLDVGADYMAENDMVGSAIEVVEKSDDDTMKKIFESFTK